MGAAPGKLSLKAELGAQKAENEAAAPDPHPCIS